MATYPAVSVQIVSADKAGNPINPSGVPYANTPGLPDTKWVIVGGSTALSSPNDDLSNYVRYQGGFTDYYETPDRSGSQNRKAVEVYFGDNIPLVDGIMWHLRARVAVNQPTGVAYPAQETGYPRLSAYVMDGLGHLSSLSTTAHPVETPYNVEWTWTWDGAYAADVDYAIDFGGTPGEFDPSTGVYVYLVGASGNSTIESGRYTTYTYLEMEVESGELDRTVGDEPFLVLSAYGSSYWGYDEAGNFLWVATGNNPFWMGFPVAAWTTAEVTLFSYEGMHTLGGDHISYDFYAHIETQLVASGLGPVMEPNTFDVISAVPNYERNTMVLQCTYWDSEFWDCSLLLEIDYLGAVTRVWNLGRVDVWNTDQVISSGDIVGDVLTFLASDEGNIDGSAYYGYTISRIDLAQASPTIQTLVSNLYGLPQMYEPWAVVVNPADSHIWLVAQTWGFSPDGTPSTYSAEFSLLHYDQNATFIDRYDFVDNTPEFAGYTVFKAGPGVIIDGSLYISVEGGWRAPPPDVGWEGFGITKFDLAALVPGDLGVADEDRPYNVMPDPWQWVDGQASENQTGFTYGNFGYVVKPMRFFLAPDLDGNFKAGDRTFDI